MDTHDVSDSPQFAQMLHKQKDDLRAAQSRKGQYPKTRKSRDELIHKLRLMMRQGRGYCRKGYMKTILVPPYYPSCTQSLQDLQKVTIKDLRLEVHHRGAYALLRSATAPDRMTAVMGILEDETGDALMIQLYHCETEKERTAAEILPEILPERAVLAVKDPFLELMDDGYLVLRVDHVSDVVFLPDNDIRVPAVW